MAENAPRKAAVESALLVYEFGFGQLNFSQSHFDVRLGNERVLAFHDRFGATKTSADDVNQYYVFPREHYWEARKRYAGFLPK